MELPVYTTLLRVERRLYQIGQVELPRPVSLLEAGVFAATFGALMILARMLGLGISPAWAWCYPVVPWLVAWASSRPLADQKRVHVWALSQLRYLLAEPKTLARLRPVREARQAQLRIRIWQPLRETVRE